MGTEASVQVVQEWIQRCMQSHPNCPTPLSIPRLPTRVIDVGDGSKGDNEVEPRLLITNGRLGQYACLSYCWGGPQPSTLTRATIAEMQQALPLNDLPNSLQDAIWWTHRLGLRYLWIDALCIIQDDELDKAREITAMDSIYRFAFITLSAAKARTCHSGFRQPSRPPNSQNPTCAEIIFPCPDGSGVGTMMAQLVYTYNSSQEWLNMRAWTLQESLLSSRVLTFGSWQMYWTCQDAEFVNGGRTDLFNHPPMRLSQEVFIAAQDQPLSDRVSVYDLWIRIVEQYVHRKLSYWEDRLPALAGIAVPFQRVLGDDDAYLAGLWLGDMPRCLAWRVYHAETSESDDEEEKSITEAPREPGTWSWASLRREAAWDDLTTMLPTSDGPALTETYVKAYDIKSRYTEAPLGQVTRAILTLHGLTRSFEWDGDEVIFDHPENQVPVPEADIGDSLRFNEHHIATLHADCLEERLPRSKIFTDEKPREDEDNEDDGEIIFYAGRGAAQYNGSRRRHVVAVPVSCHAAIVLEKENGSMVEIEHESKDTDVGRNVDREDEVNKEVKFVRLGLLKFAFVDGIDWARNMADFFAGCETRTLMVK